MSKNISHLKGILFFFITSVLWSTSGMLIKMISWNPIAIAGVRSGIASLVLLPVIKMKDFRVSRIGLLTSVSFSATVILFVSATKMTTAANAIILQYTAPIYTAIFSGFFLKEKVKKTDIFFSILAVGGIVLCFINKLSSGNIYGDIMALFSGVSFGWFYLFMRKQKSENPINSAFLGNVLTFIISIPFLFGEKIGKIDIFYLLILGIFQMGVPMFFYSAGIKYITALEAILISTIEPILNPVWVYLAVGETPGKWTFIGGMVVIMSILLSSVFNIKSSELKTGLH